MGVIMEINPKEPGWREEIEVAYVLACDLGQAQDPTAICALEYRKIWKRHVSGPCHLAGERFDVRHLARLPLGMPYPEQIAEIARLAQRPPIAGCEVFFDQTGVGAAVCDIADSAGLKPVRVVITAGSEQSWTNGAWHVAKQILISMLDARLHLGELRLAAELTEIGVMRDELKDFRRKVSAAGRFQYEARVGRHDDLVLACAIAVWACVGRPVAPMAQFGYY
jgi:hypothetical protein